MFVFYYANTEKIQNNPYIKPCGDRFCRRAFYLPFSGPCRKERIVRNPPLLATARYASTVCSRYFKTTSRFRKIRESRLLKTKSDRFSDRDRNRPVSQTQIGFSVRSGNGLHFRIEIYGGPRSFRRRHHSANNPDGQRKETALQRQRAGLQRQRDPRYPPGAEYLLFSRFGNLPTDVPLESRLLPEQARSA